MYSSGHSGACGECSGAATFLRSPYGRILLALPKLSFRSAERLLLQGHSYPFAGPKEFFGRTGRFRRTQKRIITFDYQRFTSLNRKLVFFEQTTVADEKRGKTTLVYTVCCFPDKDSFLKFQGYRKLGIKEGRRPVTTKPGACPGLECTQSMRAAFQANMQEKRLIRHFE